MDRRIKYLIVEDEEKSRETLLKKILMCDISGIECVGLAANAKEAMLLCKMCLPDFLLLDINLPGKNGFEFLSDLSNEGIQPAVIFTSAHIESQILLKAFKHAPVNYLVKPINIDELEVAIKTICVEANTVQPPKKAVISKIRLQNCYGPFFVYPEQIFAIKAEQHYSVLTLNNGESVMLVQSIADIERQSNILFPPFYKADRSTLLNLNFVESIHIKRNECILRGNKSKIPIPIASSRIPDLIKMLESFNNLIL